MVILEIILNIPKFQLKNNTLIEKNYLINAGSQYFKRGYSIIHTLTCFGKMKGNHIQTPV